MPRSPLRPVSAGFTLIELLVVISIIVLLVAILLPALQQARATVRGTVCASQVRQIAIAGTMYAINNDDRFSHEIWQNGIRGTDSSGAPAPGIGDYLGTDENNRAGEDKVTILNCPELEMRRPARYVLKRNYSMNEYLSYTRFQNPVKTHKEIQKPAGMAWFMDGITNPSYLAADGKWYYALTLNQLSIDWPTNFFEHPHGGATNVAFADGHAEPAPKALFDAMSGSKDWLFWRGIGVMP